MMLHLRHKSNRGSIVSAPRWLERRSRPAFERDPLWTPRHTSRCIAQGTNVSQEVLSRYPRLSCCGERASRPGAYRSARRPCRGDMETHRPKHRTAEVRGVRPG